MKLDAYKRMDTAEHSYKSDHIRQIGNAPNKIETGENVYLDLP